jgi:ankyrin repeat protein
MRVMEYWVLFFAIFLGGDCAHAYCSYSSRTGPIKTPLMVAIWLGDTEAVDKMLSSEASLDTKFTFCSGYEASHTTPLLNAILAIDASRSGSGHREMVEFLLRHGASPGFSAAGWTPLHMAASLGDLATVKLLLRYGASIDPVHKEGTPLLVAVQDGSIAVVRELIAAGANINVSDSLGGNLVSIAASQHYEEIVRLLVQLGIDPCARDNEGRDAVYWAGFGGDGNPQKLKVVAFLKGKCGRYD